MKTPALTARISPLVYPAALLSAASLAWTTWSLVDLLGAGKIGVTVAVGADIIWASIIVAEYRGLRIGKYRWPVHVLGWLTLLAVASLLVWHGIRADSVPMAVAGPFLPLGAKVVWVLALADMRDPAALGDDELHELAAMERGMVFEEAQHRITVRRRQMRAELQRAELGTDFDIELMRQDQERELHRRRPLTLDALPALPSPAPAALPTPAASAEAPQDAAPHHREAEEAQHDTPQQPHVEEAAEPARPLLVPVPPHGTQPAPAVLDLSELTKSEAVLLMKQRHPGDSAPQLARRLAEHGVEVSDGYVRTALGRARKTAAQTSGDDRPDGQGLYL